MLSGMNFQEFKSKFQEKEVEELSFSPPHEPVVSVLVQTYQQKNFIKECLDSILIQETTFDFEVLVGDDGSADGTRELCLEYAENYPDKIRLLFHHQENQIKVLGGPTSNFNAFYNFYSARGKYIAFCEGDDKWTDPTKLQKQVEFLQKNNTFSFTYHPFASIDERGEKIEFPLEIEQPRQDLSKEMLLKGTYHPLLMTICFRKEILDIPYEIFTVLNVDTFLISLFGEFGDAKFQENVKPSLYRLRTEGLWSRKIRTKKLESKIQTCRSLAAYFKRKKNIEQYDFFLHKMKMHYKMLVVLHLRNGKMILAGKTLFDYLKIL